MDSDLQISFFHCCDTSQLSVVSVAETAQARYTVVERVLRHFKRWFTVTAEWFRCELACRVRPLFRNVVRNTGVQILRKCMILRF